MNITYSTENEIQDGSHAALVKEDEMQFPKLDSIITEKDFEIALNFIATHLYLAYPCDDFIIGYWQSLKEKATTKLSDLVEE